MASLRAEQRELRERMQAAGVSTSDVAAEFGRRYKLRPRAAWRHAHGWSLTRAAEQINDCANAAGLHPGGLTVAMTGPHLCEYEAAPGNQYRPTERRVTPRVLALLARAYGAGIPDLIDTRDYEHLSPADRLLIDILFLGGSNSQPSNRH